MYAVEVTEIERVIRGDAGRSCTTQAAVYAWLLDRFGGGRTGPLPHITAIAKELGRQRQEVSRAIGALERKGLVQVTCVRHEVPATTRVERHVAVSAPPPLQISFEL